MCAAPAAPLGNPSPPRRTPCWPPEWCLQSCLTGWLAGSPDSACWYICLPACLAACLFRKQIHHMEASRRSTATLTLPPEATRARMFASLS